MIPLIRATRIALLTLLLPAVAGAAADTDMSLGFDCVVMPHAVVEVSAGMGGRLQAIHVERGDRVSKGQLLAELESGVESANVALAQARARMDTEIRLRETSLQFDQRRQQRIDALYEKSATSSYERDEVTNEALLASWRLRQAKDNRELAQLELRQAQELLQLRAVHSPIDGVVVERFRWPGEFVEEHPILSVAQLDPLRVEVVVPVAMHGRIVNEMRAEVFPETEPDRASIARVTVIDPMGDPASGTFRVRLELPNPENRLLGGIKCTTRFTPEDAHTPPAQRTASRDEHGPQKAQPAQAPLQVANAPPPVAAELAGLPVMPADVAALPSPAEPHMCFTAGPLNSAKEAESAAAALSRQGANAQLRETREAVSNGYVVLATPGDADGDVWALERRLRAAGITDLLVLGRGQFDGSVALGTYAGPQSAERRAQQIAASGFSVEVRERTRSRTAWWLDVELPAESADADGLEALAAVVPGELADCAAMLAARQ